ncbi:MAG: TetR/AcrR family transcriptional regulator [Agathobacter sp.]
MYHISNDKRVKKSADLVAEGILQCMETKKFTEITVADIQRASTVGRSTFYRLFDNTSDVLSYLCDQVFEQADREYAQIEELDADETTFRFIRIWMENKRLLKGIIESNRTDLIFQAHMKYLNSGTDTFFPMSEMDEAQKMYLMTMLTACTSALLTAWIKNGAKESAKQLQMRMRECFQALGNIFQ